MFFQFLLPSSTPYAFDKKRLELRPGSEFLHVFEKSKQKQETHRNKSENPGYKVLNTNRLIRIMGCISLTLPINALLTLGFNDCA